MRLWPRAERRPRFLIVRHKKYQRTFFDVILRWVEANLPGLSPLFDVRELPTRVKNWSPYALHVAWLQDPVQQWSATTYQQALDLAAQCDERGIPVVNRVDCLLNATKSRGARLMSEVGVETPRMAPILNPREFQETLLGLELPLFVREDWGHARNLFRVDSADDLHRIPWATFERPLAIEAVDVRDPRDGVYRKHRYLAAGALGISHHLQISREWITRGENRVVTPETRNEELNYISQPDRHHAILQRAREALKLDLVAFDYGYRPDGRMIVWEANPFPHFTFATQRLTYRNPAMHRTMLAIVRMYLAAAGLPIPAEVEDALALDLKGVESRFPMHCKPTLRERVLAWPEHRRHRAA